MWECPGINALSASIPMCTHLESDPKYFNKTFQFDSNSTHQFQGQILEGRGAKGSVLEHRTDFLSIVSFFHFQITYIPDCKVGFLPEQVVMAKKCCTHFAGKKTNRKVT